MRTWLKLILSAPLLASAAKASAQAVNPAHDMPGPADAQPQETAVGHGSISIAYLDSYVNGFWVDSNTKVPNGTIRSRGIALGFEYYFSDSWSFHAGVPFLSNRYEGQEPHCPTAKPPQCANIPVLNPPHPESQFIDDGNYHGTWQNLTIGVDWHTHINDYYITPSLTATIPSHDYVFFDNAAVGQRLHQLLVGATLAHQFEFSNLYYRIGYGYVFSQHVLGHSTNYQRFYGEIGYFVNERFSVLSLIHI